MNEKFYKRSLVTILATIIMVCGILALVRESQAGPTSTWSSPQSLSDWQPEIGGFNLTLGLDGTQAAFWITGDYCTEPWSIWARIRRPGQDWDQAENISLPQPVLVHSLTWDAGITPDGTVWVIYNSKDTSIIGDNMFLFVAWKHPGEPWQRAKLSPSPAGIIEEARIRINQEGVMIVTWLESADINAPPFILYAAMRYPAVEDWELPQRIDANWGDTTIEQVYPLPGPEGMTMVMWVESKSGDPLSVGVFWRTKNPQTGSWSAIPSAPISGWKPHYLLDLGEPVIGADGSVVAAWVSATANPANVVCSSATYMATSGTWSAVVPISTPFQSYPITAPTLALSQNGTALVSWECVNSNGKSAICVNVRDPNSTWEGDTIISSGNHDAYYPLVGVWPDGGAMVVWEERDYNQPASQQRRVYWNLRPPNGPWGALGSGPIGDPKEKCWPVSLKLSDDQHAQFVWAVRDASQLFGSQEAIFASTWNPGGPWETPTRISNWVKVFIGDDLIVAPDGLMVAALWKEESTSGSVPIYQIAYNQQIFETPPEPPPFDNLIFLPLVMK
jgi:hypothetical protein